MRIILALMLITSLTAGCMTDAADAQALPSELGLLGLPDVTDRVADWAYVLLDATESGDVTGAAFVISEDALALAEETSGHVFLQVTPLLPADVGLEKYAVIAFDTGRNVHAEAAGDISAQAAPATMLAGHLFTELKGQTQGLNSAAQLAQAAGAGPTTLDLGAASQFQAGDIIALTVGLQATADAAIGNVHAAAAVATDAAVDTPDLPADPAVLAGHAALLVDVVASAQSAAPSAADVQAIVERLAAEGQGQAMEVLGQVQGFTIPVFSLDIQGNVRTILQSADVQAQVDSATSGLWPLLSTETFDISIVNDVAGGFGAVTGAVTGNAGSLDWALDADLHGLATAAGESGINAGPASQVTGAFELVASGAGGAELVFQVESTARDTSAMIITGGFDLGAPLPGLIGQDIDPVEEIGGAGLPVGDFTGLPGGDFTLGGATFRLG